MDYWMNGFLDIWRGRGRRNENGGARVPSAGLGAAPKPSFNHFIFLFWKIGVTKFSARRRKLHAGHVRSPEPSCRLCFDSARVLLRGASFLPHPPSPLSLLPLGEGATLSVFSQTVGRPPFGTLAEIKIVHCFPSPSGRGIKGEGERIRYSMPAQTILATRPKIHPSKNPFTRS